MKEIRIRKSAMVLGMCIILLSVVLFLVAEAFYFITYYKYLNEFNGYNYSIFISFISPFTQLISGLGFGGIIIFLGCFFDAEKTFSLPQEPSELSDEDETVEDTIE